MKNSDKEKEQILTYKLITGGTIIVLIILNFISPFLKRFLLEGKPIGAVFPVFFFSTIILSTAAEGEFAEEALEDVRKVMCVFIGITIFLLGFCFVY